jgi:hypothetical protein
VTGDLPNEELDVLDGDVKTDEIDSDETPDQEESDGVLPPQDPEAAA